MGTYKKNGFLMATKVKKAVEKSKPIIGLMDNVDVFASKITNPDTRRIFVKNLEYITKSALVRGELKYTPIDVIPTLLYHASRGEHVSTALSTIPMSRTHFDRMLHRYPEMELAHALSKQLFQSYWEQEQGDALRNRESGFNFYSFYQMMQRALGAKGGYAAPNDTIVKIPKLADAKTSASRYEAIMDYIAHQGIGVKALTQLTAAMSSLEEMKEVETLAKDVELLKAQVESS